MKRMMLYFGSFNPTHNGHIALAEYMLEQDLCDEVALIVSPQSPYKHSAELAPELDRFEMAEIACAASKHPDRIKASAVEFLLPRPSYTIDTLRYLEQECGGRMRFSILMGGDQLDGLHGWKEYEQVLAYPIYVYPRLHGETVLPDRRLTLLAEAPLLDISATAIRERLGRGEEVSDAVAPGVADFIRRKGLWDIRTALDLLAERIADAKDAKLSAALYTERGKLHYRLNRWGDALNDFNRALAADPDHTEAGQFARMVREILEFRYKDIYNP